MPRLLIISISGIALVAGPSFSQSWDGRPQPDDSQQTAPSGPIGIPPPGRIAIANEAVGASIITADEEEAGVIADLLLNVESGAIDYAVVSVGGLVGLGGRSIALPWASLSPAVVSDADQGAAGETSGVPAITTVRSIPDSYRIELSLEQLEAAPDFVGRDAAAAEDAAQQ